MLNQLTDIYSDILHIYIKHTNGTIDGANTFLVSLKRVACALLRLFKNLLVGLCTPCTEIPQNKIWFYVIHENNIECLSPVFSNMENAMYVSTYKVSGDTKVLKYTTQIFYLLYHPLIFMKLYFRYGKEVLKTAHVAFRAAGLYELSLIYLKRYRPKAIIFANDHSPSSRALFCAATKLGIKTVYIPHGCTSSYFPPLSYSLSLLEGGNMLEQYTLSGAINSHVHLIGSPKLDSYIQQKNKATQVRKVAICSNGIDSICKVHSIIRRLQLFCPSLELTYRQHSSDKRNFKIVETFPFVHISNSKEENSLEFLLTQDLIIAGDSSIHLEACYLNVASCYFPMHDNRIINFDRFGFVNKGLLKIFKDEDELIQYSLLHAEKKMEVDTSLISFYNAAIGSDFEGKSTQKAVTLIRELLQEYSEN